MRCWPPANPRSRAFDRIPVEHHLSLICSAGFMQPRRRKQNKPFATYFAYFLPRSYGNEDSWPRRIAQYGHWFQNQARCLSLPLLMADRAKRRCCLVAYPQARTPKTAVTRQPTNALSPFKAVKVPCPAILRRTFCSFCFSRPAIPLRCTQPGCAECRMAINPADARGSGTSHSSSLLDQ